MPLKQRKIPKRKAQQILRFFAKGSSATQTVLLVGVNRNTVNHWYMFFRVRIAEYQEEQARRSSGEFELDESYFRGVKKKIRADGRRKRGRGVENKVPVFGIKREVMVRVHAYSQKTALNQHFFSLWSD